VNCSEPPKFVLISRRFDAVIFDLDGVITDTASLHAAAWKEMFDEALKEIAGTAGGEQAPFDKKKDYLRYVDGKPRQDGVVDFLASRDIELPEGQPDDPPDKLTVYGLGNRKNRLFNQKLKEDGANVYDSSIRLVRDLRASNVRTAVVSSSKNCRTILETTGISDLFDTIVDGRDAAEQNLDGKPAPDIFLAAARRLGVRPQRAAVVEDALAGVQAGKHGHFACVIGVDRNDQSAALEEHGADVVVNDLCEISIDEPSTVESADKGLPSALHRVNEIYGRLAGRTMAVFLDYDGTLTPIVRRPEDAELSRNMRQVIHKLAANCPVAIVSGRDMPDVRLRVGIDELFYAGSHGFDIVGPGINRREHPEGSRLLPEIDQAEEALRKRLSDIDGCRVERKKFAVAVHYREVAAEDVPAVEKAVRAVHAEQSGLRLSGGKKIFELQPDVEWHKGRAVRWLLEDALKLECSAVMPVYIGDDVTDEDAFEEIRNHGIGILVSDIEANDSAARYRLKDPQEVRQFLFKLAVKLQQSANLRVWRLVYNGFKPEEEKLREALCTLGNGYFATRGAGPESKDDGVHYPGTYLAGGYNRLKTEKSGRIIENEDLVNMPNWLPLNFRFEQGDWFDLSQVELLEYCQELDIRNGILLRTIRFSDDRRRITRLIERRFVHMSRAHLAGMETTLIAENWSGRIKFRSALDGRIFNNGVKRYRDLNNLHLTSLETGQPADDTVFLKMETNQSELRVALAARTRAFSEGQRLSVERQTLQETGFVTQLFDVPIKVNEAVTVEKIVSFYTSRDPAISECGLEARNAVRSAESFNRLLQSHARAWEDLWQRFGIDLENRDSRDENRIGMIVHLYIFHLLQCTSINTMCMHLDVGVPSRGWHGEAYRGHIFWDELFIFPMINLRLPEITRELLMYRYRRLAAARANARQAGFHGAMFPWQSGSNGREESQEVHLNPKSGRWIADNSHLQRHVNAAIAYNLYHYFQVTRDMEFMAFYGAEMLLEIARFLAGLVSYNTDRDRYEILGVMGPDEYHDAYPDSERPGLNNNAYTNIMTVWVLNRAREVLDLLPEDARREVCGKMGLSAEEFRFWEDICRKMRVVFQADGIISQFEGYEDLAEFDWNGYREKYGDIQRLDRVLEAENDTPNRYKASKQADVLMLFYLLSAEELAEIFGLLDYPFEYETIPKNIDYYLQRTSHGSTLSRVVHSWVLARSDRARSWELFCDALQSDVSDIQGGTTPEGIHLGAMAGTVDQLQRGYPGIVTRGDVLYFNPCLPDDLSRLKLRIRYRSHFLEIEIIAEILRVSTIRGGDEPIKIGVYDKIYELAPGSSREFSLKETSEKAKAIEKESGTTIPEDEVCQKAPEWAEHSRLQDKDEPCDDGRSGNLERDREKD
jgi:alpha,alpha-trehalase